MNYDTALSEICKRARQVPGGTCGYWGVCGAAAGAGIFMSVMTGIRSLHNGCMALSSERPCLDLFYPTGLDRWWPRCL